MNTYFVTFPSGISKLVLEILNKDKKIKVTHISDGIAEIQSSYRYQRFLNYRFITNIYISLGRSKFGKSIEDTIKKFKYELRPFGHNLTNRKFKVRVSMKGKTVSFNKKILFHIEQKIKKFYRLYLDTESKANEFWFYIRENNEVFFGMKVTHNKKENKERQKGELRVEIASLMSRIVSRKNSVVIDPFAGYGSIVSELKKMSFVDKCFCNDIDKNQVNYLKKRFKSDKKVVISNLDYKVLEFEKEINYIVTDPPWRIYDKAIDYKKVIGTFSKWLKEDGAIVLLVSEENLSNLYKGLNENNFKYKSFNVLVGGNKSSIVIADRK